MKIHKEGYTIILLVFIAVAIIIAGVVVLFPLPIWLEFLLYLSGSIWLLFTILFFRVPFRSADYANNKIFSSADGKIVAIEEIMEDEYLSSKRIQISVFMSATNVHVNFAPVGGTVRYYKYHPGQHLVAWHPKSSIANERTTVVIENNVSGPVLIRQIAGTFARRIVCHLREGSHIEQGAEIGIIKFGSRVDIVLPLEAKIKVKLNQRVRGGETLLATLEKRF